MGNGRCRYHGGKTPSGDEWHRLQLPKRGEARGVERLDAKLIERDKRLRAKQRRLKAMSPEERERHAAWQATHRPGRAADRARSRENRKLAAFLRKEPDAAVVAVGAATAPPTTERKNEMEKSDMAAELGAAAVKAELLERVRTEGVAVAYATALQVLQDPKAPAPAKATMATNIFRVAGFLEKPALQESEVSLLDGLSPSQLQIFNDALRAAQAAEIAAEDEPSEADDVFG